MIQTFYNKYRDQKIKLIEKIKLSTAIGLNNYIKLNKINSLSIPYLLEKLEYIKNGMGIDNFTTLLKEFDLYNIDKFNGSYKISSNIIEQMNLFLDKCIANGEIIFLSKLPQMINKKYENLLANKTIRNAIESGQKLTLEECYKVDATLLLSIPTIYLPPQVSSFIQNNYKPGNDIYYFDYSIQSLYNILQGNPLHYNRLFQLSKMNLDEEISEKIIFDNLTNNFLTNLGTNKKDFIKAISRISKRDTFEIMLYKRNLNVYEYMEIIELFSNYPNIHDYLEASNNSDYGLFIQKYAKEPNYLNNILLLKNNINDDFFYQTINNYKNNPNIHDDDMINYFWKYLSIYRKNDEEFYKKYNSIKEILLRAKRIDVSASIIEASSLYNGVPFNYIDKIKEMGLDSFILDIVLNSNKEIPFDFTLVQKNKDTIYQAIHLFTERELQLIFKSKNINISNPNLRLFYNTNTFCSDSNNGVDLFDQLLMLDMNDLEAIDNFRKSIKDKYDFDTKYTDFVLHNAKRILLENSGTYNKYYDNYINESKNFMLNKLGIGKDMLVNFDLLNLDDLACQSLYNLETTKRWIEYYKLRNSNEKKDVKLDLDFITKIPISMVDSAYESQSDYHKFFTTVCQKYNIAEKDLNVFSKSFLGLAISFDYFNAEDKKTLESQMLVILDKELPSDKDHPTFNYIFGPITYYTNVNYLKDLRENYGLISNDIIVLAEYLIREKNNVSSVKELIDNCSRTYRNICVNAYESASEMFINGIDEETFKVLHGYYVEALERESSTIPYTKGESDGLKFETLRLWDSYLMSFDSKNKFANCNLEIKKDIMTNNNIRVIVIKDITDRIIGHLLATRKNDKLFFEYLGNIYDNDALENLLNNIFNNIRNIAISNGDVITNFIYGKTSKIESSSNPSNNTQYVDPVKQYTVKKFNKNVPEFLRVSKLYSKAFDLAKTQSGEFSREIYNHTSDTKITIGRDWYLSWEKRPNRETGEEEVVIHQLARYNENINSSYGRQELLTTLKQLIDSETCIFDIAAQRPSYYPLAKMAANGEILVRSDNYIVVAGEGMFSYEKVLNQFIVNDVINSDLADGALNTYNNYPSTYSNSISGNRMKFYSTKSKLLTINEQKELEEQKRIYRKVVERLDLCREQERKNKLSYHLELNTKEKEKAQTILGIDNVEEYNPNYIRYKIKQYSLFDFNHKDLPELAGKRYY